MTKAELEALNEELQVKLDQVTANNEHVSRIKDQYIEQLEFNAKSFIAKIASLEEKLVDHDVYKEKAVRADKCKKIGYKELRSALKDFGAIFSTQGVTIDTFLEQLGFKNVKAAHLMKGDAVNIDGVYYVHDGISLKQASEEERLIILGE